MNSWPDKAILPVECGTCAVRRDGVCATLTTPQLISYAQHSRHTRHQPGEALAIESGDVTGYANVIEGVVKLSRVLRDGRQQLVGLQFAPDLLGRLFGTENLLTAEAASAVQLCRVPKSVFEGLVASSPTLQQRLLTDSLQQLDEAREWMVTLGRKTAAERVASVFLLLATRHSADGAMAVFELPLGRADIADFLGLTIETVSRQISRLRRDGVVRITNHRQIEVPDLKALRHRTG